MNNGSRSVVIDTTKTKRTGKESRESADRIDERNLEKSQTSGDLPSDGSTSSGVSPLADLNAVWYLQVPHGPQYGPATGAVVESWIKERRVAPGMLVWKEGWSHWIEAKNAFPELAQLFSNVMKIELPSAPASESMASDVSSVFLTMPMRAKIDKKKKFSRNTIILTTLTGLIVLLGVLLVVVLNR